MARLLSICIPTYNRAAKLDRQLAWVSRAICSFEEYCEIIVFDNCSTDNTPDILNKWKSYFKDLVPFIPNRNSKNIGLMPNIGRCIQSATGAYVWAIGDDDPMADHAIAFVINALKKHTDLSLLFLNFSSQDHATGQVVSRDWLDRDLEAANQNGREIFRQCIEKKFGSVIFLSANIYRTDLAKAALAQWPGSLNNWGGVAYWAGYCASQGSVMVTKDDYLRCIVGASSWQKDPKIWVKIRYQDIPEVYEKLEEIGYPRMFCRKKILAALARIFVGECSKNHRHDVVASFFKWPKWTFSVVGTYLVLAGVSVTQLFIPEAMSLGCYRNRQTDIKEVV